MAVTALAFVCLMASGIARAQGDWLTLTGDAAEPFNPRQNVIQVNPMSISESDGWRTMSIRVSRAENRTSWDDVPYRSFTAVVEFDCEKKTARYMSLDYYLAPGWQGAVHETSVYTRERFRPMAFRQVQPNPTQRIIRAACESKSVTSN